MISPPNKWRSYVKRLSPVTAVMGVIITLGVVLRLFRWTEPILDQHAFRQTQTASTVWLWREDGFDFFNYHVPQFGGGHWILELPVYQLMTYVLAFPIGAPEQAGRLVSVLSYVAAAVLLFVIGRRLVGQTAALIAVALFSIAPINVFYFRALMIDPLQIAVTLLAMYALFRIYEEFSVKWFAIFVGAFVIAALGKASIVIAIGLPLGVLTLRILAGKRPIREKAAVGGVWVTTAILAALWARHSDRVNEASNGMTFAEQRDWFFGSTISDATLWTTVGQRFIDNLGIPGVFLVAVGIAAAVMTPTRYRLELVAFLVGGVASVAILANLNRIHDYYQLPYYVPLSLLAGLGLAKILAILAPGDPAGRRVLTVGAVVAIANLWSLALFQGYYHPSAVNHGLRGQAIEMKDNTPDELLLVASQPGDPNEPMHLYEARRRGWRIDSADTPGVADRLTSSPEIAAVVFIQDPASVPPDTLAAVSSAGYRETHRSAGMLVLSRTVQGHEKLGGPHTDR